MFDSSAFLKNITTRPGVYQILGVDGRVLYVGKAKNLKNRLSSYFRLRLDSAKTRSLMSEAHDVKIIITRSDNEALILENNLIKKFKPRYNISLRDSKSYPYIYLSAHDFPRMAYYRGPKSGQGYYFGPYPNASALRETIVFLQKLFLIRTCTDSFFRYRSRPCLLYQLQRCSAPCVNFIDKENYQQNLHYAKLFLEGKSDSIIEEISRKMDEAVKNLEFELAGQYRDQVLALRKVQTSPNEIDIIAHAESSVSQYLAKDRRLAKQWADLCVLLKIEGRADLRAECFDISHTGGERPVASCVVFDKNGPLKQAYRRFNIHGITPGDDYAALTSALLRRFKNRQADSNKFPDILLIDGGKGQLTQAKNVLKELNFQDICLMGVAKGEARKPGLEKLFIGHAVKPVLLAADSPVLHLIQRIRDEAHRFAMMGHRKRRAKARLNSVLKEIPGIGGVRSRELLRHFGGLQGLKQAAQENIAKVEGIGPLLAEQIYIFFHGD